MLLRIATILCALLLPFLSRGTDFSDLVSSYDLVLIDEFGILQNKHNADEYRHAIAVALCYRLTLWQLTTIPKEKITFRMKNLVPKTPTSSPKIKRNRQDLTQKILDISYGTASAMPYHIVQEHLANTLQGIAELKDLSNQLQEKVNNASTEVLRLVDDSILNWLSGTPVNDKHIESRCRFLYQKVSEALWPHLITNYAGLRAECYETTVQHLQKISDAACQQIYANLLSRHHWTKIPKKNVFHSQLRAIL